MPADSEITASGQIAANPKTTRLILTKPAFGDCEYSRENQDSRLHRKNINPAMIQTRRILGGRTPFLLVISVGSIRVACIAGINAAIRVEATPTQKLPNKVVDAIESVSIEVLK